MRKGIIDIGLQGTQATKYKVALANDIELAYCCWNPLDSDKPPLLLLHGTGFVATTFNRLAEKLVSRFQVYAYDRRGHGDSSKPDDAYALEDFAEDCRLFCQSLSLVRPYAVGHSAGGTDILVAEATQVGLFKKIFVMEPTIIDPIATRLPKDEVLKRIQPQLDKARMRRYEFESRQQVFELYQSKPLFSTWERTVLAAYINDGFAVREDGMVTLQCLPDIEARILQEIYLVFSNANIHPDPFLAMKDINCELAISSSELSQDQFSQLSTRARAYFPQAKSIRFDGLGHCVPQENPRYLAKEVLDFF